MSYCYNSDCCENDAPVTRLLFIRRSGPVLGAAHAAWVKGRILSITGNYFVRDPAAQLYNYASLPICMANTILLGHLYVENINKKLFLGNYPHARMENHLHDAKDGSVARATRQAHEVKIGNIDIGVE